MGGKVGRVGRATDLKFLGLHISEGLGWTMNTTNIIIRVQHFIFFLRTLRMDGRMDGVDIPRILIMNCSSKY